MTIKTEISDVEVGEGLTRNGRKENFSLNFAEE